MKLSQYLLIILPSLSLVFFQNCSETEFAPIDYEAKLKTMSEHQGLGNDPYDQRSNSRDNGSGFLVDNGKSTDNGNGFGNGNSIDNGSGFGNGNSNDNGSANNGNPFDNGTSSGNPFDNGLNNFGMNNFDNGLGTNRNFDNANGNGRSPDGGNGTGRSPDDGTGYGKTPDNATGYGKTPDNATGYGKTPDNATGYGKTPDNATGYGKTPDNATGYGKTPDNATGYGKTPDNATGVGKTPDNSTPGSTSFNVGGDTVTNPGSGRFSVLRWCRGNKRATLKDATDMTVEVIDTRDNSVVCQGRGPDMVAEIIDKGQLTIANCNFSHIPNKNLQVRVKDQNGASLSDVGQGSYEGGTKDNAFSQKDVRNEGGNGEVDPIVGLHLLYGLDDNIRRDMDMSQADPKCDIFNQSPLVVDMRSSAELRQLFELTAPHNGVEFNIEGERALPSAHTKKLISWFRDPRIMPIVLPKNGQVFGIDELFGNNTMGPDGKFSDNGFAALAKYDTSGPKGKRDGYITEDDAVYSRLRVWYDRNLDGVADRGELFSLARAGVTIIDLSYDPRFRAYDAHGNMIKYKSVAKLKSGKLKPVFDIWFAVNKLIQKQ